MKRCKLFILLIIAIILCFTISSYADWTIQQVYPGTGVVKGNYVSFGMLFTSDGSAMSATDIVARIANVILKRYVQGYTLYKMNVSPGTGGVAPNAAFDITLTNDWDKTIYSGTSITHTADSWPDITATMDVYPPVLDELNIAFSDIGDSGDQVTLYFYFWNN